VREWVVEWVREAVRQCVRTISVRRGGEFAAFQTFVVVGLRVWVWDLGFG